MHALKNIIFRRSSFKFILALIVALASMVFLTSGSSKISQAATDQPITDQNGDGVINLVDARILTPPATISCPVCVDVNQDKIIDQKDVDLINRYIANTNPAIGSAAYKARLDVNNDGAISQDDVNLVQTYIGQSVTGPAFGLDNPSELTFGYRANELLVKYKNANAAGIDKNSLMSKYDLTDSKVSLSKINTDKFVIFNNNIEQLQKAIAQEPEIEKVYKNRVHEPATNDIQWWQQWGPKKINIEQAWYIHTGGSRRVKVIVLDTGVNVNHEDLQHNISATRINTDTLNETGTDYSNDVTDYAGHGTLMAGTIAATVDNSMGIAGLNRDVELIPIKSSDDMSDALAIDWAERNHVDVINMSFGYGYDSSNDFVTSDLLREARQRYGIILVGSAGNDGRNDCLYPANDPSVICVGATKEDDTIADFSSGKRDADIYAPGDNIITTSLIPIGDNYTGYLNISGTSPAATYISGVAALCRAVQPLNVETSRPDLSCGNFVTTPYGRVDAYGTLWYKNCHMWDFDNTNHTDIWDVAAVALRRNTSSGNPQYSIRYDLTPPGGDGKIDDADILIAISRANLNCPPR